MQFLEKPPVQLIRKNHALEHATLKLLSRSHPRFSLAGYSDQHGFWIMGDIKVEDLQTSAEEALQRLKSGESELAFHPNCGTNFVVMGLAAALASWFATLGAKPTWKSRMDRLPTMILFSVLGLIVSQPYAHQIQRKYTTKSEPGNLRILRIEDATRGGIVAHRVYTTDVPEA